MPRIALPDVPRIETERLVLRVHTRDDFEASAAMWADPVVRRFIGGTPSTAQQSWARILGYIGHWPAMQFGYWAIEDKATGTFVGEAGFADFKRDIVPSMQDVPEIGWALVPSVHGRRFGTEAARAVVAWGDRQLASSRTVCLIDAENLTSLRIAEKCGYVAFERSRFREADVVFFERYSGTQAAPSA